MPKCLAGYTLCDVLRKELKALKFWSVWGITVSLKELLPVLRSPSVRLIRLLADPDDWTRARNRILNALCFLRAMCFSTGLLQELFEGCWFFFFFSFLSLNCELLCRLSHFSFIKKKWGWRVHVSFNACRNLRTVFPQARDEFWTRPSNN